MSTLFAGALPHSAVKAQVPAQAPELALSWDGSGCSGTAQITARVEQLLRRPLAPRASRSIRVRGRVEVTPLGHELTLTFSSGAGVWTRQLTADDCEQLTEATALVLALAIEPSRATELMAVAAESSSEPAQEPSEEPAPDHAAPTEAAKTRRWTVELGAGAALSWGDLPSASPGPMGAVVLGVNRWRVGLVGAWWLPQRATQMSFSSEVSLWTLELRTCRDMLATSIVRLEACLGAEAGQAKAAPPGDLLRRSDGNHGWAAALAHLRGVVSLAPHLSVGLSLGMDVPITRRRFVVENAEGTTIPLHRPSQVGLRASLDLAASLASW